MEHFDARSYQLEMLDQILRQNIIVVVSQFVYLYIAAPIDCQMDTGSGKTHVYVQDRLRTIYLRDEMAERGTARVCG